jgi:hypothetical protein
MGLKSAYRKSAKASEQYLADKGPPPSEKIPLNDEPDDNSVEVNLAVAKPAPTPGDAATARLQQQLGALHSAEQLQQQTQARAQAELNAVRFWRHHGVSDSQLQLILSHGDGALTHLSNAVGQEISKVHRQGTPEHTRAAIELMRRHASNMERDAVLRATPGGARALEAMNAPPPTPQEPAPFRAPPPPPPPEPDSDEMGGRYSAPVSREVHSGSGARLSPGQVRLSAAQVEAAALAGISATEYARQLAKLGPYKASRGDESAR